MKLGKAKPTAPYGTFSEWDYSSRSWLDLLCIFSTKTSRRLGGPLEMTWYFSNRIGCPVKQENLGSKLTRRLAQQLGAAISWDQANPGYRVSVAIRDG
jgi:hypothetical protein